MAELEDRMNILEARMANLESKITPIIRLPQDQYAHPDAATEWWWHTGTLVSSDGKRTFGFEVNATGLRFPKDKTTVAYTQISIADVTNQRYYQNVTTFPPSKDLQEWAQSNATQPWMVQLPVNGPLPKSSKEMPKESKPGKIVPAHKGVVMTSYDDNPLHMQISAAFEDTGTPCRIQLKLAQEGNPLLVGGTGVIPMHKNGGTNYYYSLTRLKAEGQITIGEETFNVNGCTWMDHEYGDFPKGKHSVATLQKEITERASVKDTKENVWVFHAVQLDNGIDLSNFTNFGDKPQINVPQDSTATVLFPDGTNTHFLPAVTTPLGPTFFKSKKGIVYFLHYKVEIKSLKMTLHLTSSIADQLFQEERDIYEGVATCVGSYNGQPVSGKAWIEQLL